MLIIAPRAHPLAHLVLEYSYHIANFPASLALSPATQSKVGTCSRKELEIPTYERGAKRRIILQRKNQLNQVKMTIRREYTPSPVLEIAASSDIPYMTVLNFKNCC
jgi:hypothetical protein